MRGAERGARAVTIHHDTGQGTRHSHHHHNHHHHHQGTHMHRPIHGSGGSGVTCQWALLPRKLVLQWVGHVSEFSWQLWWLAWGLGCA